VSPNGAAATNGAGSGNTEGYDTAPSRSIGAERRNDVTRPREQEGGTGVRVPLDRLETAPRLGVVIPPEGSPGWVDGAWWAALLEAWGYRAEHVPPESSVPGFTTLIVPTAVVDDRLVEGLRAAEAPVLLAGARTASADRVAGVRFERSAEDLGTDTEEAADAALLALREAAPAGLVGVWRWPGGASAALVVDGDVDHPTGVDPECARYVAPALETARRAGYPAYGIFATAAAVDAEPASFPPAPGYYNHSYSHPYSHWNPRPWEDLHADEMAEELGRSRETFRERLGVDDEGIFRLPHFQHEAFDRSADTLEALGYRSESSVGGNRSITGGLPYHPARRAWSARPADAALRRTHPEPAGHRTFLQLPITTDPTDPRFPNGCCSYHTLGEGVRSRTAGPEAYGRVLDEVLDRAIRRQSLAHLFIDPPDAGFGRLPGDHPDYASVVERWMRDAVGRSDLAILTTAELTTWWLAREAAIQRLTVHPDGRPIVELDDPPPGLTLEVVEPSGDRRLVELATVDA
jgi:hypothetical protein